MCTSHFSQSLIVTQVAGIILCIWAYYSDKLKMRAPFIYLGLICLYIGYAINLSNVSSGVKYFGTFWVVTGAYAAFPGTVAWCVIVSILPSQSLMLFRLGNNLAGQYKRGIGLALQIGLGNFSGAIACNIYRSQDEPKYILGRTSSWSMISHILTCCRCPGTDVR